MFLVSKYLSDLIYIAYIVKRGKAILPNLSIYKYLFEKNSIIHHLPQGITGKGAKIKKVVVMMGGCVIVSVIGSQIPFIGHNLPIKKSDLLLKKPISIFYMIVI